ncbi:1-deoxy-D-xylulose-5-phosphate synthase [Adlercreutzia sp. ZJ304]|uniref:1-deoxy-D-xylulose-5-phosphate synthase n=1 Tax=Adlercreutzia sp. ZJ304 TaxID=2709791 RepID=UPI0013EC1A7A|nr:1-deoxy-D-xylulose-5-phosphate synthase [Adlercreutzia sp. ZJ304]
MAEQRILDCIKTPADLHLLTESELGILADEIRQQIIDTTSKTGGHVASSLGAVEIILACHSLLDEPNDKLIFDVGHQSYAHKLVTGRLDKFDTLRTYHGLSGFPRPSESPYDAHPSGHASDSLSVASGFAKAKLMRKTDEKIVAIIGDASLAGGMAFEALNYIGTEQLPMVIILNDNEMSISRNVGALMKHFGNIRANNAYRNTREIMQEKLESGGWFSNAFAEFGKRTKDSMKHMFLPESMIYEQLGIVCTPPLDGHNIHELRAMLKLVLETDGPVLMHVVTKKGAGYEPAMADPERFHGVGPYDPKTGKSVASAASGISYTQAFGDALVQEAKCNNRVVAITAAMEGGTGLKEFHREFPDRFIDVGIAEEQAIGMASGMAAAGMKPVVAVYSTFMQRAIDQMIVDVALPELDVVFALDRAGVVGSDGPTHHGVFDIVYARMVPNMRVFVPSGANELASAVHTALAIGGPVAIRYPRGKDASCTKPDKPELLDVGKAIVRREGSDVAILAFGRMVEVGISAADLLEKAGISARVVDMRWVKPLDADAIAKAAKTKLIVTIEEGVINGGAGEAVLDELSALEMYAPALVMGIPDSFIMQGNAELLLSEIGLDAEGVSSAIKAKLTRL